MTNTHHNPREFSIRASWRAPLHDVWHGHHGKEAADHVYVVFDSGTAVYVGSTIRGVHCRLHAHRYQPFRLGFLIQKRMPTFDGLEVEVIEVGKGTKKATYLLENRRWPLIYAENHYIRLYKPRFNVAMNTHNRPH